MSITVTNNLILRLSERLLAGAGLVLDGVNSPSFVRIGDAELVVSLPSTNAQGGSWSALRAIFSLSKSGQVSRCRLVEPVFGGELFSLAGESDWRVSMNDIHPIIEKDGFVLNQGVLWLAGPFSENLYTFDSAGRLPDRLAEKDGFLGYKDWRIPTLDEFKSLFERLAYPALPSLAKDLRAGIGAGGPGFVLWTSTRFGTKPNGPTLPNHNKCWAFNSATGESIAARADERYRIILVRDDRAAS